VTQRRQRGLQPHTHTETDGESEVNGDALGAPVRDKVTRALCEGDAAAEDEAVDACEDRAEKLTWRERAAATEAHAEGDGLPDELCEAFEDGEFDNAGDLEPKLLRV